MSSIALWTVAFGSELSVSIHAHTALKVVMESVYHSGSQIYVQVGTESIPDTVGDTGVIQGTFDLPFPSTLVQFTFEPAGESDEPVDVESFELGQFLAGNDDHWVQSYEFKDRIEVSNYPWVFSPSAGWIYVAEEATNALILDAHYLVKYCYSEELGWFVNYARYFTTPGILIPMETGYPFNL